MQTTTLHMFITTDYVRICGIQRQQCLQTAMTNECFINNSDTQRTGRRAEAIQDLNLFLMISYTTRRKLLDDSSSGSCRSFVIRA